MMDKFGSDKYLIYLLILVVFVVISSFIAAAIYKSFIHKYTAKLSCKVEIIIKRLINDSLLKKT